MKHLSLPDLAGSSRAPPRAASLSFQWPPMERHGFRLPVDVDNMLGEHVIEEAPFGWPNPAPMIHYGFNEHNMGLVVERRAVPVGLVA